MAIKILNVTAAPMREDDGIVASIANGVGTVPDYRDLGGDMALRFEDLDAAEKWAAEIPGSTLEDHGDSKRKHYLMLPAGFVMRLAVQHLSSKMSLKNAADWSEVRSCDGVEMVGGESCVCAKLADHGSAEMRQLANTNQACKPSAFMVGHIVGFEGLGKVSFSKSSESTVRPMVALEEEQVTPFTVTLSMKQITSKKLGHTWSVPEFADVVAEAEPEPF
jgi:hypothetical protein